MTAQNDKTNSVIKYNKNDTTIKGTNIEAASNFAAADKQAWLYVGIAELVKNAFNRTAAIEKAVNGFQTTGIFPFSPDLFSEEELICLPKVNNRRDETFNPSERHQTPSPIPAPPEELGRSGPSGVGTFLTSRKKKKRYAPTIVAIDSVEEHPKLSLRARSSNLNISKSQLQRIYKSNKVKAFKPQFMYTIEAGDADRRLLFCLTIGEKCNEERNFYKNVVFSDEVTFSTNGGFSSQNWSTEHPNFRINCRRQYYQKVNVWCAVSYRFGVIGPYFIEGQLNQDTYVSTAT
ncbi:transposable element tc3 transposase-like protein [Holotrichia oblita]|uniref:Transposable element tc3 transposase-like protein n=1 Tax=Holotrichia oblita TaxID=644536 RepID=A0ACB9TUT6_HOLOL|nr:transposable element tc3 transposase-like protein [Holotrichia oblita]